MSVGTANAPEPTAARRELAAELVLELEQRLADLERFGGMCGCRHAEARAFLAKLKQLAGDTPAPAPGPNRARYARRP